MNTDHLYAPVGEAEMAERIREWKARTQGVKIAAAVVVNNRKAQGDEDAWLRKMMMRQAPARNKI